MKHKKNISKHICLVSKYHERYLSVSVKIRIDTNGLNMTNKSCARSGTYSHLHCTNVQSEDHEICQTKRQFNIFRPAIAVGLDLHDVITSTPTRTLT